MDDKTRSTERDRLDVGASKNEVPAAAHESGAPIKVTPSSFSSKPDPSLGSPILNGGTDPDSDSRRSGSSINDPHGGHEYHRHELRSPEADPVQELVPGGQGAEAPPYRPSQVKGQQVGSLPNEVGRSSDDLGSPAKEIDADDAWPAAVAPAVDPMSPQGLRREGMAEGGTGVPPEGSQPVVEEAPATSLAFTDTQRPNLPSSTIDEPRRGSQGSGIGQENVERRANALVFDRAAGNFVVKDEEHGTSVTSQDHDALAPRGVGKVS